MLSCHTAEHLQIYVINQRKDVIITIITYFTTVYKKAGRFTSFFAFVSGKLQNRQDINYLRIQLI